MDPYLQTLLIGIIVIVVVLSNIAVFVRFWQDKQRAIAGQRRIPEADLLGLAFFGGSPSALLARRLFRHKTRKEPFSTHLLLIFMVHLGLALGTAIAFA